MEHLYNYSLEELTEYFKSINEKPFRAKQVFQWLYQKNAFDFQEMSNISKDLREKLEKQCIIDTFEIQEKQVSSDGTIKYLFKMIDGNLIEAVLMRHDYGQSLCVTSQVGCNMQCAFCASGLLKKQRNLTAGEIVAQIMQVQQYFDDREEGERVSHIVVMGIGEPFDNYKNVMTFLNIMNDSKGLNIGARHMTVSTSGLVPKIKQFAKEPMQINLAISLHAPNNEVRTKMMVINKAYPLERLMDAVDYYLAETNRRITFEYIMLSGVNDLPEHAEQLANLLEDKKKLSYVNLIPYNSVSEHDEYKRSTKKDMIAFYEILKKRGVNAVMRQEFGSDIDAACGQLRSKQMKK